MASPAPDLRSESDEDLLVFMSWRSDEPEQAKAACEEFYERHVTYVYAVLSKRFGKALGEHGVEDMVMETFTRVFERAGTYEACGSRDPDVCRRNARAWIGQIARNACMDYFRKPDTRLTLVDEWQENVHPEAKPEGEDIPESDGEAKLMCDAMASLNERERTVLQVTMMYWDVGRPNQRLPNTVAQDLARSCDTTTTNIRKIRERAILKVKRFVESARGKV